MFDLTIYPICIEAGREQNELPGLLITNAPRKSARMRAQDHLILHLRLRALPSGSRDAGGVPYSIAQQQEMLRRLAETYFNFSGSVTAGMRAVAARMNDFLLSRNLKAAQNGQTVGILNLAVIHGSTLMVAHAGSTHTFVLGKSQVQHFNDGAPQGSSGPAGRGLGLSRVTTPRFYQAALEAGDLLVVCPEPPAAWSERALASSPQLSFDHIRRRLLAETGVEFEAALVRLQPGKGLISYWKPGERVKAGQPADRIDPAVHEESVVQEEPAARHDLTSPKDPPVLPVPPVQDEPAAAQLEPGVQEESAPPADAASFETDAAYSEAESEAAPGAALPDETEFISTRAWDTPEASENSGESSDAPPVIPADRGNPADLAGQEGLTQSYKLDAPGEVEIPPLTPRPRLNRSDAAQTAQARPAIVPAARAEQRRAQRAAAREAEQAMPRKAESRVKQTSAQPRQQPRVQRQPKPLQIALPVQNMFRKLALRERMGGAWLKSAPARGKAGGAVSMAVRRVIPQRRDPLGRPIPLFNISAGTMLAVAVIIPLIVVAVAAAVYFEAGRGEQYEAVFVQAQQYAQQAVQQTDPLQQRESWSRAFELVRKAEQFQRTDASRALVKQSQDALDALEGYTRLDFRPALSTAFSNDVRITRMIATLNDVYLLDSSQGRILRLFRTATGYEVDPGFQCGPGKAGTVIVGPLIDLAALSPTNDLRASVLGIDGSGNLVYCSPSVEGFDSRTLALPDLGWGGIQGISLYGEKLYVLDPKSNGVYYYDGLNGVFDGEPRLYFGETIPKMADVIDLAIDQEFLYLLHDDGQMTICEGGGYSLAVTRCSDTPYGDGRAGYEATPLSFVGTRFTQIQTTQPPDPSLFALDVANHSVYHLSLRRLNLQRQYLPQTVTDFPLPETSPSSFAVAPNRRILLAFDNQVYFALIP